MGLLLFATLIGAASGFFAWLVLEPFSPGLAGPAAWSSYETVFSLVMALFIGAAIGGLNGWNQGSKRHLFRGMVLVGVVGAIGGFIGFRTGGQIGSMIAGNESISSAATVPRMFARMIAFALFGAGIGAALGASGMTVKRFVVGAMGGFVGGLLAGFLFDPISSILGPLMIAVKGGAESMRTGGIPTIEAEIGAPGRAVMGIVLGGMIGLFTSIFILATRSAWLRLSLGRNEGKEWLVDAHETFIGRSEGAHVPLFGDPNVAPMHAKIVKQGSQYILVDLGTPLGVGVNGQRVYQLALFDGAQINIGTQTLTFMMKAGEARRAAEAARSAPMQMQPIPPGPQAGWNQPAMNPQQMGPPSTSQMPQSSNPTMVVAPQTSNPTVAVAPSGGVSLLILDGPMAGQRIPVGAALEVGRESAGLSVPTDPAMSRKHAVITPVQGGVEVRDLGSTNGTFVDGARIQQTTLRVGDVVKLGGTSFRIELA